MLQSFCKVALLGLFVSAALPAAAQPTYTAKEVAEFFLGTRGICVGTDAECQTGEKKGAPGFQMHVTFERDSAVLTKEAEGNLDEFAKAAKLDAFREGLFLIEGHADASGSERHNLTLSEERAASVRQYLVSQGGVPAERLKAFGVGETKPAVADPYDPANRRVEARLQLR